MKRFYRFVISFSICAMHLLCFSSSLYACVGARPLSMGGSFVAVADDANATYWNPAGLTQLEDAEFTYTPTLHDRDEVNYDDFVSLAFPLLFKEIDLGALGFSFVNSGYKSSAYRAVEQWYGFSYGKKLLSGFSLGLNLRHQHYKDRINSGWSVRYGNTWVDGPNQDSDDIFATDVSLLWKWVNWFSFGLLWQDINEPEVTLFGEKAKYIRNLRPGFALRPDDKTILSLELYDATGESSETKHNLRLGLENIFALPWQGTSVALRTGLYNINAENKTDRAVTGGLGYKFSFSELGRNNRDWPIDFSIDYCLMYWTDPPSGSSDSTHLLGFKISLPWDALQKKTSEREVRHRIVAPPERLSDKESYFRGVREAILQHIKLPDGLGQSSTAKVIFSLSPEGRLENIYEVSTPVPAIKDEIVKVLLGTTFPSVPQEMRTENELRFNLRIDFLQKNT